MQIDLAQKVVLITGAGDGIGREVLETFADEGAVTVALDVDEASLVSIGNTLASRGAVGRQHLADVRDLAGVEKVVAATVEEYGRIDVLINNAGVDGEGRVEQIDPSRWDRCFDINVKGVFHTCRAVIPTMKRQRRGRIINATSFSAIVPIAGAATYAASKSAVAQFTRALAGELGPWNITVNAYAPGMVPTALSRFASQSHADQERLLDTLTLRKWGSGADVADLLCFLASDRSGYITGAMIEISGGKLATQFPSIPYQWAATETG